MSGRLGTDERFNGPDDVYELLVEAHRDLSAEQSRLLDAKLILLLANHIGEPEVLAEAVALARAGLTQGDPPPERS